MQTSTTLGALAAAMAKAQAGLESASKNAKNPHLRTRYADLDSVVDTIRPVLAAHGLCVVQGASFSDGLATIETRVIHGESGEWVSDCLSCPVGAPKGVSDAQALGSALTYLRRYSLLAMACVAPGDDDDGHAAGRRDAAPQARRPSTDAARMAAWLSARGADLHRAAVVQYGDPAGWTSDVLAQLGADLESVAAELEVPKADLASTPSSTIVTYLRGVCGWAVTGD